MTRKEKKRLSRILATGAIFAALLMMRRTAAFDALPRAVQFVLFLIPYLIIGYDVIAKAGRNIRNGNVFDENFLMMIATFGAFAIGEYAEAVAVMLFYQTGELFQDYAVGKSRASIAEMMNIVPEYANLEKDGNLSQVDPEDVQPGDIIVIRAGERVPLDGTVLAGESFLDTAALTGESVPRRVRPGDDVISGCINGANVLRVEVKKPYEDSTVARILELVENAGSRKARVENFITRFARYYTPVVTFFAIGLAVIPPLVLGGGWSVFAAWLKRACIFLIVSCPCALVISVPLGFFGGIGSASRIGVLVKGSNFLEAVSQVRTVVFDKTGTVTKGQFRVREIVPEKGAGCGEEELLRLAAEAEAFSNHPAAAAIREAAAETGAPETGTAGIGAPEFGVPEFGAEDVREIAGQGICVRAVEHTLWLGNRKLMEAQEIPYTACEEAGTIVYIAKDRTFLGHIRIDDEIKETAADAVAAMKRAGVARTVMLTGDTEKTAQRIASAAGIDEVHAELLPGDKVSRVEELLAVKAQGEKLAFVGDGINDAPVLTRADVGIAMGSLGSDAAIEAADIVLMDDDLNKIASVIRIGRKTMRIVKENIVFALGVKGIVLVLGALGAANMWEAVFADVGVAVLAILNSMRALRAD
ncbi:MAG: heavy metal translocating P-type ATPase [Lachnospiraceae bacterium]|nr:heavy metal translocating P-type ATPase [Lachnospiraceae bacterium]